MRLIRNIAGEPRPLIMHPRLRRVRKFDRAVRYRFHRFIGTDYRSPRYERSKKTPEQQAEVREACRNFLGSRSPNPQVAAKYRERARQALLRDAQPKA